MKLNDMKKGAVAQMVYGGNGTGKSFMLGGIEDALLIATENRIGVFQSQAFKKVYPKFNPHLEIVTEPWVPEGGAKALDTIVILINDYDQKHPEIKNIIIDGSTELRRYVMNKGLEMNQRVGKSKTLDKLKQANKFSETSFVDLSVQDYGAEMQMVENFFKELIDYCRGADKNLIVTAHERIEYIKGEKLGDAPTINKIRPGFTGQTFPDAIPGIFDNVWRTDCLGSGEQTTYRVTTNGNAQVVAKTTVGAGLFKTIETNMNLGEALKKMRT